MGITTKRQEFPSILTILLSDFLFVSSYHTPSDFIQNKIISAFFVLFVVIQGATLSCGYALFLIYSLSEIHGPYQK